jgi:hypothetical protein
LPQIRVFKEDGTELEKFICYECLSNQCDACLKDKCECEHDEKKWKFRQEFLKEQEDKKKLNMDLHLIVSAWAYQLSNFLADHGFNRPNQVLMKWEPVDNKFIINLEAVIDEKKEDEARSDTKAD